jgi:hypothetical protein
MGNSGNVNEGERKVKPRQFSGADKMKPIETPGLIED